MLINSSLFFYSSLPFLCTSLTMDCFHQFYATEVEPSVDAFHFNVSCFCRLNPRGCVLFVVIAIYCHCSEFFHCTNMTQCMYLFECIWVYGLLSILGCFDYYLTHIFSQLPGVPWPPRHIVLGSVSSWDRHEAVLIIFEFQHLFPWLAHSRHSITSAEYQGEGTMQYSGENIKLWIEGQVAKQHIVAT